MSGHGSSRKLARQAEPMTLITLFSAPKAFTDPRIATSQRNAIQSWKVLGETEILLLGDEEGLATAAREIGVRHLRQVAVNQNRVPLISSMFRLAREAGHSPMLGIINSDIILMSDFFEAVQQVASLQASQALQRGFVLVSQRWDLEITKPLEFNNGWEGRLRAAVQEQGRLHRPTGSDLFLFPSACYQDVPDFAIGRGGWDNWMIYRARKEGWQVIDITPSAMIVHQIHDYGHLPGAKPHYDHPDTEVNATLAGGRAATRYSILDCTDTLVNGRLRRPKASWPRFERGLELLLRRVFFFLPEDVIENVARPQRWNKRLMRLLGRIHS
jgi:hypothetical protein